MKAVLLAQHASNVSPAPSQPAGLDSVEELLYNRGMADEPKKVFKVPAENLPALMERIAKVNRRVARLASHGVKPIEVEAGKPYGVKVPCPRCSGGLEACPTCHGRPLPDRVYVDVELKNPEPPRVNGWEFVAALTHIEGVGAVLRVVPGAQVAEGELKRYRDASPNNCDHCGTMRRRNDTYILRKAV